MPEPAPARRKKELIEVSNFVRGADLHDGLTEFAVVPFLSALGDYELQMQQIVTNWGYDALVCPRHP